MLEILIRNFKLFDSNLTGIINDYLKGFIPPGMKLTFVGYLPEFLKIIIYSLVILLPVLFLKVFIPDKKFITYTIYILLIIIQLAVIGVFLGFFQLLYS